MKNIFYLFTIYAAEDDPSEGGGGLLPPDPLAVKFPTVGSLIGQLLPYIYTFAGLALLIMLIWGGITLMTSAGNPDGAKAGYGRIIGAVIGFLIIFISYFVVQLVEVVFGIKIL